MNEHRKMCSTKAQRLWMTQQVLAIAIANGASMTARDSKLYGKRCTALLISKGEWRCMMDFDGNSRVGAFLGHWYHDGESDATLPPYFGFTIHGSENPYHRRKATTCENTFAGFLESIRAGLEALPPANVSAAA